MPNVHNLIVVCEGSRYVLVQRQNTQITPSVTTKQSLNATTELSRIVCVRQYACMRFSVCGACVYANADSRLYRQMFIHQPNKNQII